MSTDKTRLPWKTWYYDNVTSGIARLVKGVKDYDILDMSQKSVGLATKGKDLHEFKAKEAKRIATDNLPLQRYLAAFTMDDINKIIDQFFLNAGSIHLTKTGEKPNYPNHDEYLNALQKYKADNNYAENNIPVQYRNSSGSPDSTPEDYQNKIKKELDVYFDKLEAVYKCKNDIVPTVEDLVTTTMKFLDEYAENLTAQNARSDNEKNYIKLKDKYNAMIRPEASKYAEDGYTKRFANYVKDIEDTQKKIAELKNQINDPKNKYAQSDLKRNEIYLPKCQNGLTELQKNRTNFINDAISSYIIPYYSDLRMILPKALINSDVNKLSKDIYFETVNTFLQAKCNQPLAVGKGDAHPKTQDEIYASNIAQDLHTKSTEAVQQIRSFVNDKEFFALPDYYICTILEKNITPYELKTYRDIIYNVDKLQLFKLLISKVNLDNTAMGCIRFLGHIYNAQFRNEHNFLRESFIPNRNLDPKFIDEVRYIYSLEDLKQIKSTKYKENTYRTTLNRFTGSLGRFIADIRSKVNNDPSFLDKINIPVHIYTNEREKYVNEQLTKTIIPGNPVKKYNNQVDLKIVIYDAIRDAVIFQISSLYDEKGETYLAPAIIRNYWKPENGSLINFIFNLVKKIYQINQKNTNFDKDIKIVCNCPIEKAAEPARNGKDAKLAKSLNLIIVKSNIQNFPITKYVDGKVMPAKTYVYERIINIQNSNLQFDTFSLNVINDYKQCINYLFSGR
jgi:hypothetical protein